MELQGSDGTKLHLNPNSTTILGRGNPFPSTDLSVSRRHLSFDLNYPSTTQTTPTVSFQVLGKNPIWVYNSEQKDAKIKSFKRFQRGELGIHDLFCVSPKNPVWFSLKKVEESEGRFSDELSQSLENVDGIQGNDHFGLGFVDVQSIDPVQEFGFLVIGHEFDQYPKHMIHDINNWDWFLDDPRGDSSDEEDSKKKRVTGGRRKRKKTSRGDDDVDEEWTAESEGEEITTNARKIQRPKYDTRSKDHRVHQKGRVNKKSSTGTSKREEGEEEESEDEEDETLGGFIVDDNTTEDENGVDDDEEEEFVDDEDELED